jgi:hypothetical protein
MTCIFCACMCVCPLWSFLHSEFSNDDGEERGSWPELQMSVEPHPPHTHTPCYGPMQLGCKTRRCIKGESMKLCDEGDNTVGLIFIASRKMGLGFEKYLNGWKQTWLEGSRPVLCHICSSLVYSSLLLQPPVHHLRDDVKCLNNTGRQFSQQKQPSGLISCFLG